MVGFCRVCLLKCRGENLIDWYLPMKGFNKNITYKKCFEECTGLDIKSELEQCSLSDDLRYICRSCVKELQSTYKFIEKAQKSFHALQVMQSRSNLGKQTLLCKNSRGSKAPLDNSYLDAENLDMQGNSHEYKTGTLPEVKTKSCLLNMTKRKISDNKELSMNEPLLLENSDDEESQTDSDLSMNGTTNEIDNEMPHNVENTNLVCNNCNMSLPQGDLERHVAICKGSKMLLCYACPRKFRLPTTLYRHEILHKKRKREFKCEKCGREFFLRHTYKDHQKTHELYRKPQYHCDQCDKSFFHKGSLTTHRRIHDGVSYPCHICSKSYTREIDLKIHFRSHSGELPYECSKCDKRFKQSHLLFEHKRQHEGSSLKCFICDKEFVSRSTFYRHRFEHIGMPLKCAICDKGFHLKKIIRRHIRTVHMVDDEEEVDSLTIKPLTKRIYRGNIIEK